MTKPAVHNRLRQTPVGAIYIGRPSKWGNPFQVSVYGRKKALSLYAEWIRQPEQLGLRNQMRRSLKGKDLVCWCSPSRCHGDLMLEIIAEPEEVSGAAIKREEHA